MIVVVVLLGKKIAAMAPEDESSDFRILERGVGDLDRDVVVRLRELGRARRGGGARARGDRGGGVPVLVGAPRVGGVVPEEEVGEEVLLGVG